ncbi:MAG: hypothetical protein KA035_01745 [Candidatus Levybacteria bacterium]|nr:hypothetical protein [Candidatus Levybacteria bacterium]
MLGILLVVLIALWFLGYLRIDGLPTIPDVQLFVINGQSITLWNILIFAVICWAIGVLPSPFRQIAGVLLIIWVLATLGILAISGLASIIVIAVIVGIILALLGVD